MRKHLRLPNTFVLLFAILALMMAPVKGFVEAALIIGFVLIAGGAFPVLQKTEAIDSMIESVAKAHSQDR